MELVSIIIMLLGIAVLVALYFMSRSAQNNMPKDKEMNISAVHDDRGRLASSVKEDSGYQAHAEASSVEEVEQHFAQTRNASMETQLALFIAARDEDGLDCDRLLLVFDELGLEYGEMSLFHRMALTEHGEVSLYKIANGVEPWTLNPEDIRGQLIPGLSAILDLPSVVDDQEAIEDFILVCQKIAELMNADLKNTEQGIFSDADRQAMLALVA